MALSLLTSPVDGGDNKIINCGHSLNYHSSHMDFLPRSAPELRSRTTTRDARRHEQEEKYLQEVQRTDDDADIESVGNAISGRTTPSLDRRLEHAETVVSAEMLYLEDLETQLQERDEVLAALCEETSRRKKYYAEVVDRQKDEIQQASGEPEAYRRKSNCMGKFGGDSSLSLKRSHGAHGVARAEKTAHERVHEDFEDLRKRRKRDMTEPSEDLSERQRNIEAAALAAFRPETLEDLEPLDADDDMRAAELEEARIADLRTLRGAIDQELQREKAARLAAESALQEEQRAHAATQRAHRESIRACDDGMYEIEQDYSRHLAAIHGAHLRELEAVRAQAEAGTRQLETWLGRQILRSAAARIAAQRGSAAGKNSALKSRGEQRKARQASRQAARKGARKIKALRARVEELERRGRERSWALPDSSPPPRCREEPEPESELLPGASAVLLGDDAEVGDRDHDHNDCGESAFGAAPASPSRMDAELEHDSDYDVL